MTDTHTRGGSRVVIEVSRSPLLNHIRESKRLKYWYKNIECHFTTLTAYSGIYLLRGCTHHTPCLRHTLAILSSKSCITYDFGIINIKLLGAVPTDPLLQDPPQYLDQAPSQDPPLRAHTLMCVAISMEHCNLA